MVLFGHVVVGVLIVGQGRTLLKTSSSTGLIESKSELTLLSSICLAVTIRVNLLLECECVTTRSRAVQDLVLSINIDAFWLCVGRYQAKPLADLRNLICASLWPIILSDVNTAALLILALRLILELKFLSVEIRELARRATKAALRI